MQEWIKRYPKLPRLAVWGGGILLVALGLWSLESIINTPPPMSSKPLLPIPSTPGKVLSTKELWVHRMEGKADDIHKDVDEMRHQHQALKQQIDMMSEMVTTLAQQQVETARAPPAALEEGSMLSLEGEGVPIKKGPAFTIVSLSPGELPLLPKVHSKSVDEVIPAGTYAAGVLTSGIAASTALNAQGDPQPVMVRLTSPGQLPRGFKSDIQEAVIIAACYGDLSSERAQCRLNKLLLVERNGEILSQKAEGWLIGDDGIPGIKGRVVDKAGEVVRSSFWAGLLGGIASYFKASAQQPPFLLTSAGAAETKQMAQSDLMKSAGATGVSNALERIADFALKRAEQMQPVIMVHPGRLVDVVFKEEVDLSASTVRQELVHNASAERQAHAQLEASQTSLQLTEDFK